MIAVWRRFVSSNATSFSVTTHDLGRTALLRGAVGDGVGLALKLFAGARELPLAARGQQTQPRYSRNSYVRWTSSTESVYGISSNTLQSKLDSAPTISEERSSM